MGIKSIDKKDVLPLGVCAQFARSENPAPEDIIYMCIRDALDRRKGLGQNYVFKLFYYPPSAKKFDSKIIKEQLFEPNAAGYEEAEKLMSSEIERLVGMGYKKMPLEFP